MCWTDLGRFLGVLCVLVFAGCGGETELAPAELGEGPVYFGVSDSQQVQLTAEQELRFREILSREPVPGARPQPAAAPIGRFEVGSTRYLFFGTVSDSEWRRFWLDPAFERMKTKYYEQDPYDRDNRAVAELMLAELLGVEE